MGKTLSSSSSNLSLLLELESPYCFSNNVTLKTWRFWPFKRLANISSRAWNKEVACFLMCYDAIFCAVNTTDLHECALLCVHRQHIHIQSTPSDLENNQKSVLVVFHQG